MSKRRSPPSRCFSTRVILPPTAAVAAFLPDGFGYLRQRHLKRHQFSSGSHRTPAAPTIHHESAFKPNVPVLDCLEHMHQPAPRLHVSDSLLRGGGDFAQQDLGCEQPALSIKDQRAFGFLGPGLDFVRDTVVVLRLVDVQDRRLSTQLVYDGFSRGER